MQYLGRKDEATFLDSDSRSQPLRSVAFLWYGAWALCFKCHDGLCRLIGLGYSVAVYVIKGDIFHVIAVTEDKQAFKG